MEISLYQIAERFIGMKEIPGTEHNPQILAMLHLDASWPEGDETPWCSAFLNYCAWLLDLPRSKSLRARSWLQRGIAVDVPKRGFDVVILSRGTSWHTQPGPEVIDAPGHVGLFSSFGYGRNGLDEQVWLLGGNQGDSVSIASFDRRRILGIRRLWSVD